MLLAIKIAYLTSVTLVTKKFARTSNFCQFENFHSFNIASIWHQIWKDHMQIIHEKVYILKDVYIHSTRVSYSIGEVAPHHIL